jgi:hypothetical protein
MSPAPLFRPFVAAPLPLPLLALALILGCSSTGQPEVSYEAYAVPAAPGPIPSGEFTVTLDEAVVAFGPAYFCAAASGSSTLCEAAVAELTEITAINALDPAPQALGTVDGFTGKIQSASYDFGVHWFLTENEPTPAPVAPGGHAARFVGRAVRDDITVDFVADIDVLAQFQGQRAVPTAPVSADVGEEGARLEVHIDPGAWLAGVDWEAATLSSVSPYPIAVGSPEHNAIVIAMVSTHPPVFVWTAPFGK